jgi:hypothetical protein
MNDKTIHILRPSYLRMQAAQLRGLAARSDDDELRSSINEAASIFDELAKLYECMSLEHASDTKKD